MITFAMLPMALKTVIATVLFLTMEAGLCVCIFTLPRAGRVRRVLLPLATAATALALVLYASVIPAERAGAYIPPVSLAFASWPVAPVMLLWLLIAALFLRTAAEEIARRRRAVTASSVKESLDHLHSGLCFAYPNGRVILTNLRMNEMSHALFGRAVSNALLFWEGLCAGETAQGTERLSGGEAPEFRLQDGSVWRFRREEIEGAVQISCADVSRQHQLLQTLQDKNRQLEDMNARIRDYGGKVDEYVAARERLETRVNLHGFLGQALLMTRRCLQEGAGDPSRIIDLWQRNIDVLRMEAEPRQETDSIDSLRDAAAAVGMQVHVSGRMPEGARLRKLIALVGAETLTNAVRHGGARQLWIGVTDTPGGWEIRYTNDGGEPASPLREGGGLSDARRRVEAAGGRMTVQCSPRFMLTLCFDHEVTSDG